MKKLKLLTATLRFSLTCCTLLLLLKATLFAQCINYSGPWNGGMDDLPAVGDSGLSFCIYAGNHYDWKSAVPGRRYTWKTTVSTDFITIRSKYAGGAIVACGTQPLTYTAVSADTLYVHFNTNSSCGTSSTCRDLTVYCNQGGITGCTNTTAFGTAALPASSPVTVTCIYAAEYELWTNAIAGNTYKFTSSVAADFLTVRKGTSNGPIVAMGPQPVCYTALTGDNLYVHVNLNSSCGTQPTCRNLTATLIATGWTSYEPCTSISTITACDAGNSLNIASGTGRYALFSNYSSGKEKIYSFTPSVTGDYSFSQTISPLPPGSTLYYFYKPASAGCNETGWTLLDWMAETGVSHVTLTMTAGVQYYIMIDHWDTLSVSGTMSVNCLYFPCSSVSAAAACGNNNSFVIPSGVGSLFTNMTPGKEIIYTYTPAVTGSYAITQPVNTTGNFIDYYVKSASGGCNNSGWTYSGTLDEPQFYITISMTAGVQYYILADPRTTSGGNVTFKVNCLYFPCASVSASAVCGSTNSVTIPSGIGAYDVAPWYGPGKETIYTYTPPVTGSYTITQSANTTGTYTVYLFKPSSGGCNNSGWTFIQNVNGTGTTSGFNMTAGVQYYILLDIGNSTGGNVTFKLDCPPCAPPAQPGTITVTGGIAKVCPGDFRTYTIAAVPGATSYTWTPPAGASITSGQGNTSVIINYTAGFTVSGTLSVVANSACGSSIAKTLTVSRNNPSTPGVIIGAASGVCAGTTGAYSVANVAGITYNWTAPANASIASGQGTNAVTVSFSASFTTGTLKVTATNNCGTSGARTLSILSKPATPSVISGASSAVCAGTTGTYTVTNVSGVTYNWTAPANASIASGQGTNSVSVSFSALFTSGSLTVSGSNACGTSALRTLSISSKPAKPGTITGQGFGNCNATATYSIVAVAYATSYTWTTNIAGAVVIPNGTSASISFPVFTSGTVSVTANNACGSSAAKTLTVKGTPATPASITGPTLVCANQFGVPYSIAAIPTATSYTWTGMTGSHISDGVVTSSGTTLTTTSTSVTVNFGSTSGNLNVKANNACGAGTNKTLTIGFNCRETEATEDNDFDVKVFPNPSSGDFVFEISNAANEKIAINIYDVIGKLVLSESIQNSQFTIRNPQLTPGIYSAEIILGENKKVMRLVKTE